MEERLCYCKCCQTFYVVDPLKPCPKCGQKVVPSDAIEKEGNPDTVGQESAVESGSGVVAEGQSTGTGAFGTLTTSIDTDNQSAGQNTAGLSDDTIKRLKSYKNWSIAIAIIGIVSFLAMFGEVAELEAQGYIITDKTPVYLIYLFSAFCSFAGFYGMGVYKQTSRLNISWIFYIIILIGMAVLAIGYRMIPGWLCALGCLKNVFNGNKLKQEHL